MSYVTASELLSTAEGRIAKAKRLPKMWPLPFPAEQGEAVLEWLKEVYGDMVEAATSQPDHHEIA